VLLKAFSIFDNKAHIYHAPFFQSHLAMAMRMVEELVNDPKTMLHRHPGDYELIEVGSFDDSTGLMTDLNPSVSHGRASQFLRPVAPDFWRQEGTGDRDPEIAGQVPGQTNGSAR
jgi:hypothetical protein